MSDQTATMSKDGDAAKPGAHEAGLVLVFASPMMGMPRAFVMTSTTQLLGREATGGGWAIPQAAVSRVHATLQLASGVATVRDMRSRNGTFVNGVRVHECTLAPGDIVRIGDALFQYTPDDARAHVECNNDGSRYGLIGGVSMARLADAVDAVGPGRAAVLVSGETGVGKELAARAVHDASKRSGRFVAVNCAAIPVNLLESELFGHERGAFTGAVRTHEGLVRAAREGTLFLDEIGDLPLDAQAKLLRVLETREVLAVGASRGVEVDVRVVSATHRDLVALVREGQFRADLYARIAQRVIAIPPLRSRMEDLAPLVTHFLEKADHSTDRVSFGFMNRLALYDWPFNVRELGSAVLHAVEQSRGGELQAVHLPKNVQPKSPPVPVVPPTGGATTGRTRKKPPSAAELHALMEQHAGNVAAVARALDRDPAQVFRWLRQHAMRPDDFR